MKGILFTEFLAFVTDRWGSETVERVAKIGQPPTGGDYDPLARYHPEQFFRLTSAVEASTGLGTGTLLRDFGAHLFTRFAALYPVFFAGVDSATAFLSRLDTHVHAQVRKLDPDAELPTFGIRFVGDGVVEVLYSSPRPLADLADGLIRGCIAHFEDPIRIERRDDPAMPGRTVTFTLRPAAT